MSVGRHFGLVISRMPRLTYAATIRASEDCRFVCSACYSNCWGVHRLHGETAWLCPHCADMKDNGLVPGPRPFNTQPPRQLSVREQLRSPEGVWTVTSSERVKTREDGTLQHACMYVLTHEDGHEEEWRGRDMADFHLIPAEFEHITRARCNELGAALTAAGLSWEDNARQDTPRRLTYTATGPRARQWTIRPVPGIDFDPWQPSNLWQAVCTAPHHRSPVLSALALADHIRELSA
ncbi:hypothetical protein [Streptomyces galilaeus]|uniref:hypothetical protein n=1 Tax=Streptomyces galilaeus TaxID=33899 RepID=UPI0038F7254C